MHEYKVELEMGDGRKWATTLHSYSGITAIEAGRALAAKEGYTGSCIGYATQLS